METKSKLIIDYNVELTQRVTEDFESEDMIFCEFKGQAVPTVPVMTEVVTFTFPAETPPDVYESAKTCHAAFKKAERQVRGTDRDPGVFLHKGAVEVARSRIKRFDAIVPPGPVTASDLLEGQ